jgi:aspartyl-tRNA(Asn)/glutamyl-tRNA(Gln) amidotransferase subunit A
VLCVEEMIVRQTAGQQEITSSMNRPLTSELIAQLQSGETTSRQLVENSLRRISELNGVLNAFVSIDADGALAKADEIDQRRQAGKPVGRLAGLPVAVKDNMCTIGLPTSCGSRMLKDFRAPYDAHVDPANRRLKMAS